MFGRLKPIEYLGKSLWKCICTCGNEKIIKSSHLGSGGTKSCGCIGRENPNCKTHGLGKTTEHKIWTCIIQRCTNSKNDSYHRYGGRGITICKEWRNSFETFLKDMGNRPSSDYTIDRINNNLGYSKENCKWASRIEQANNRRNNIIINYDDKTFSLPQFCRVYNLNYKEVYRDYKIRKYTSERIINKYCNETPRETKKNI
jgi:hypothetical protein